MRRCGGLALAAAIAAASCAGPSTTANAPAASRAYSPATDYDGGNMDGFGLEGGGKKCPGQLATAPYQYVDPLEVAPYWQIAQTYVLGDHMFQTQGSGYFTAHQDLIAEGSTIDPEQTKTLIDFPSKKPWGCDAPKGTKTSLIIAKGRSRSTATIKVRSRA